mgnify:CR=1 FL=1
MTPDQMRDASLLELFSLEADAQTQILSAGLLALAIDGNLSLLSVPQRFFDGINSFPLMAVPFFILAADLMTASGITTALLRFAGATTGSEGQDVSARLIGRGDWQFQKNLHLTERTSLVG